MYDESSAFHTPGNRETMFPNSSHSHCSHNTHPRHVGTAVPANTVEQDIWHYQYILSHS